MTRHLYLFFCIIVCIQTGRAQSDSLTNELSSTINIPNKTISSLQEKYSNLTSKLNEKSAKLLAWMQRKETRLYTKLNNTDDIKAQQLFSKDISQEYRDLQSGLIEVPNKCARALLKEYLPGIDSVQTSLNFLLQNADLPTNKSKQLQALNATLKGLQEDLQKANDIQAFVKEREVILKEQLVNTGLVKKLKEINKQVYYYQAQLAAYKETLNDKEKLKEKFLETVRTLPAFQKFWQKNSYLTALFPTPDNVGTTAALAGLQTCFSVQTIITQRIGGGLGGNIDPRQYFQEQISAAQAQLNQLKDKLSQFSNGGSGYMTMPDFKPNDQKAKSFLKRLEYGINIQSESSRYSLPSMSDIALTIGYKLSDTKRFGIGASYKIGWGNIKHIDITSEGVGLRSYVDIKIPAAAKAKILGNIWISGGFEYNYLSSFKCIQELHNNVDVWQRSMLLGLSKKYKAGKREGNLQLLYDFLHNLQTPPGTALKFRIGYTL